MVVQDVCGLLGGLKMRLYRDSPNAHEWVVWSNEKQDIIRDFVWADSDTQEICYEVWKYEGPETFILCHDFRFLKVGWEYPSEEL